MYNLSSEIKMEGWERNDISGVPIASPVFEKIQESSFLVADITKLNENVVFEVGYAIGCGKRVLLVNNASLRNEKELAAKVGSGPINLRIPEVMEI